MPRPGWALRRDSRAPWVFPGSTFQGSRKKTTPPNIMDPFRRGVGVLRGSGALPPAHREREEQARPSGGTSSGRWKRPTNPEAPLSPYQVGLRARVVSSQTWTPSPRAAAPALPHTSHAASSPFFPKRPQDLRGTPGPLLLESNSACLVRLGTKSSSSSGERVVATTPVPGPSSHLLQPGSRSFLPPASTSQEGSLASPSIPEGRCPNPGRV